MIDYKEFENKEIDRFMEMCYDPSMIYTLLENKDEDFPAITVATKKGISEGIESHLANITPRPDSIYHSNLCLPEFDNVISHHITKDVEALGLNLKHTEVYGKDVVGSFKTFLYNFSLKEFEKLFSK